MANSDDLQRLLSKAKIGNRNECWPWKGRTRKDGYAQLRYNGKTELAHRVSWILHEGAIPPGKDVLHRCDNRPCINPSDLFLGDDFVNQQDRVNKGRHKGIPWPQCGEENKSAKLSDEAVLLIRAAWRDRTGTQKMIALQFGINQSQVSMIVNRKAWSHLTDPP